MQHLGVNFGGIWRSELGFFIWVFLLKKSGLIFKIQWQRCRPPEAYAMCSLRKTCNAIIYPS